MSRDGRINAVVAALSFVAVGGLALSWYLTGPPQDPVAVVILAGLGLVSQFLRENGLGRNITLSFLSIILLACIPSVGPVGAGLVGAIAYAADPKRAGNRNRVFNTAMTATLGWVGGLTYIGLEGRLQPTRADPGELFLSVALPVLVAGAVQMLVNAGAIAAILWADIRAPLRTSAMGMVTSSGPAYLGYGAIGFLLVVLWYPAGVGPFSAVLILAPLFVAQWVIVQYGEEVRSHESALSGLLTAVEIKDPMSRGHGTRVAQLAEWMTEPLGVGSADATAIRFAAQLHDVGKVGLPTRVVRAPATDTPDDLAHLAQHAVQGETLLSEMAFLAPSLAMIRHHHERWDGHGYPDGLAGEAIPLGSRIIAVADAFDSLTSDRPGRPARTTEQALAELDERGGSHLDPRVVQALRRALERRAWQPERVDADELAMMRSYLDHDAPSTSDLMADMLPRAAHGAAPRAAE